ncbi:hypothetical protein CALCODRAFT_500750 [Calocera cornea HHB12733]|uniref:ShKT domain-containing protein n=1 Tax=Calocera cornea HHB12733 TaxID=1353952 RepID=A0A165DX11_9BASI|nr:hypothetical protein CALCODRAFT_500750 [Calocera cornea HHB12733]
MNFTALLTVALLAAVPALAGDHPDCAVWKKNGICTSKYYNDQIKAKLCPKACGYH